MSLRPSVLEGLTGGEGETVCCSVQDRAFVAAKVDKRQIRGQLFRSRPSPVAPPLARHLRRGTMSFWFRPLLVLSPLRALASLVSGEAFGITLHLPARVPEWAEPLSPHLASLSIEMDRWTDWAGAEIGQPNEYVNQLLRNLGERTGSMPFLRVGGESTVP